MSELTREERKQLVERGEGWKLADESRLLFPIIEQTDINRLPGLLAYHSAMSEQEKQRVRQRAVRAARRQGFKLPPTLEKELATMNQKERDALREIAAVVVHERVAIFAEYGDETDDAAEARKQAERFVDSLKGGRTMTDGNDEQNVRREAERFAEDFNRRHGGRR